MVEHAYANGRSFSRVIKDYSRRNSDSFVNYCVPWNDPKNKLKRLADLTNQRPELDRETLIIHGAIDENNAPLIGVSAPRAVEYYVPPLADIKGLPPADQTFLVTAYLPRINVIPTLAENRDAAIRAIIKWFEQKNVPIAGYSVEAVHISQAKFIAETRNRIKRDKFVPGSVLRYAGLREFQRKVYEEGLKK